MDKNLTKGELAEIENIPDWDSHMIENDYSPEQRDFVRQSLEKRDEWLRFCEQAPWENVSDGNNSNKLSVWQCASESGVPSLKASKVLDYPVMQVYAATVDERYAQLIDEDLESWRILRKVAANTILLYEKYKAHFMWQSRDFISVAHVCRLQHASLCPSGGVLAF